MLGEGPRQGAVNPHRFSAVFCCGWRSRARLEISAARDALTRVCGSLDGPMGDAIREAERAE
jgi:hypothetical protein